VKDAGISISLVSMYIIFASVRMLHLRKQLNAAGERRVETRGKWAHVTVFGSTATAASLSWTTSACIHPVSDLAAAPAQ
jgi:hypothetical protein